jgi:hypothetical protein
MFRRENVDSPNRKVVPRPPPPYHRQSQFMMWTLKIHVTRISLVEDNNRCEVTHDGSFPIQKTYSGTLQRGTTPENLT